MAPGIKLSCRGEEKEIGKRYRTAARDLALNIGIFVVEAGKFCIIANISKGQGKKYIIRGFC